MSWWALFNGSVFSRRAVTKQATEKQIKNAVTNYAAGSTAS